MATGANVKHRHVSGVSECVYYKLNNIFKENATEYTRHA